MRVPASPRRNASARPTLIGLPYDASSSYLRGPAVAPPKIREALFSPAGHLWSEALIDLGAAEGLADVGDLELPPTGEARARIEEGARRVLEAGGLPLSLGGDHSVTYPILRAVGSLYPGLTLVQIDAHPDLYEDFEGDRYSHACPFARILEEGLVSRLIQIGIRTLNDHQRRQAERFGVEIVAMRSWTAGARPTIEGPVYLSVDVDGIDPAFAPGVSHREAGGLTPREVIAVIQSMSGPLIGADVVELNPSRDPDGITASLCAKLVKEIASRMIETASVD